LTLIVALTTVLSQRTTYTVITVARGGALELFADSGYHSRIFIH